MPRIAIGIHESNRRAGAFNAARVPGLTLDLNPDTLAAGAVGTWGNSGSAGGSFTAAGANRPTCTAAAVNGHNEVDFDGTDDLMTSTLITSNICAASAFTWYAVANLDAIDTNAVTIYDNDALLVGLNEYVGMHFKSAPSLGAFVWDGAEKSAIVATVVGSYVLLQMRLSGGVLMARSGGAAAGTTAGVGNIFDLSGTLRLGGSYSTQRMNGKIARVLVYNVAVSGGADAYVRAGLAATYGVAA